MYAEIVDFDSEESYLLILIINSGFGKIFYDCKVLPPEIIRVSPFSGVGAKGCHHQMLIQRTLSEMLWNIYVVSNNILNACQFKYIGKYAEILFNYFFDPQADPPVLNRNGSTIENVCLATGNGAPIQLLLKFCHRMLLSFAWTSLLLFSATGSLGKTLGVGFNGVAAHSTVCELQIGVNKSSADHFRSLY